MREPLEGMELYLGMDVEPTEGSWVRIKERTSMGDIAVGDIA